MKGRWGLILLTVLMAPMLSGCLGGDGEADYVELSKAYLEMMENGDYGGVYSNFSADMMAELTLEELGEGWEEVTSSYGNLVEIMTAEHYPEGDYEIAVLECMFEGGAIFDIRFVYDDDKKISGLWTQVGEGGYSYPSYVDTSTFSEEAFNVISGDFTLEGILSVPNGDGPFPVVVLVHGSGPNDMDESIGPNKPFKDIAGGLASMGIAVLRYEKRTYAYNLWTSLRVYELTVQEETIDDALAAVSQLRDDPRIEKNGIFVLGHSLGGMLAPRIAQGDPAISGIIMVAANARPIEALIVEQVTYLCSYDGKITEDEQEAIDEVILMAEKISDLDIGDKEVIFGAGRTYWQDLAAYDQIETAKGLGIPILILQGERDYQVTMEDFGLWQDALSGYGNVSLISYPGLNHLLIYGTERSNGAEYMTRGVVSEALISDIVSWIEGIV